MRKSSRTVNRSDEDIRRDIVDKLTSDSEVDASDIEVDVDAGIVTLRGDVVDSEMSESVQQDTERVAGVLRVVNKLAVSDSAFDPDIAESMLI